MTPIRRDQELAAMARRLSGGPSAPRQRRWIFAVAVAAATVLTVALVAGLASSPDEDDAEVSSPRSEEDGSGPDAGPSSGGPAGPDLTTTTVATTTTLAEQTGGIGASSHGLGPPVSASARDGNMSLRVSVDHNRVPTASVITISIDAEDNSGFFAGGTIDYGNGDTDGWFPDRSECPPPAEGAPAPPLRWQRTVQRAYRQPGTFTLNVGVGTVACGGQPYEWASVAIRLTIDPGPLVSNGPLQPGLRFYEGARDPQVENTDAFITVDSWDDDGYLARMVISWGDGSPPTTVQNSRGCNDSGGRLWPESGTLAHGHSHRYERPGTYTVTATLHSVGCDGRHAQTAVASRQLST